MTKQFENLMPHQMEAASSFLSKVRSQFREADGIAYMQAHTAEQKVKDAVESGKYDADFLHAASALVSSTETHNKLVNLGNCIEALTDADVLIWASDVNHPYHKRHNKMYTRNMNELVSILKDLARDHMVCDLIGIMEEACNVETKLEHYPDGQLRWEGTYKNGELHGLSRWYYPSGQLRLEYSYENRELHGLYQWWYPNGQLMSEKTYENGKRHGLQRTYSPEGQLMSEKNYKNGELIEQS